MDWKNPTSRIGIVVLGFGVALVVGAAFYAMKRGAAGATSASTASSDTTVAEFERGYRANCIAQCVAAGSDATSCRPPCECTLARLYGTRPREEAVASLMRRMTNGQPSADLRAEIQTHSFECIADQYDENFVAGCGARVPRGRTQEQHTAHCRCVLTSLRSGMGRGEGTRWLLENLDANPMSDAARAGITRATAACPDE